MKHKYQQPILKLYSSGKIFTLLCLLVLLTGSIKTQAQFVYIPDPNFRTYLQTNYPDCMSGDNLDTTCTVVINATELFIANLGIADLTGIQYFDNLILLDCANNQLQSIDWLPSNLSMLTADSNQLTSLPPLPLNMVYLDIRHNNIASLPALLNLVHDSLSLFISDNPIPCIPDLPELYIFSLMMCNTNISCLPELPNYSYIENCGNPIPPTCPAGYDCDQFSAFNVTGYSFVDANNDCIFNTGEQPLPNRIIEVSGGQYYLVTNSEGKYSFYSGIPGTFNLSQVNPNPVLWDISCFGNLHSVDISSVFDTFNNRNFPNEMLIECPWNTIDIATDIQRKCFSTNKYAVTYCNEGTATSFNTYIEINFDSEIIPLSSTFPWSSVNGTLYTFNLGTLNPGQCGSFIITDSVSCDAITGQTACVEAHIYPDSICEVPNELWDKSSLKVTGGCNAANDTIIYVIENIGTGDMIEYSLTMIYEDDLLKDVDSVMLDSSESVAYMIPATGKTYRLEVEQSPNHPGFSLPRSFIELCGNPPYSLGKITPVPQDDEDPWVEIDCHEIVQSFDPNAKQVQPSGVGPQHYITANDGLDYIINFQNTGTDTAFKVVLKDEIDVARLDLTSFQPGPSSHPYELTIEGQSILKFTFNNILLPDSNVNEAGSHGFVKFNIRQKPGNVPGVVINNSADIYFDFNAPVTTNTTFVTIELPENIFTTGINNHISFTNEYKVNAWPNPFHDHFHFEINTIHTNGRYRLELYDLMGKKLFLSEDFKTSLIGFNMPNLSEGVYIYKLFDRKELIAAGKLVKQ